jgi:hypothetical protein
VSSVALQTYDPEAFAEPAIATIDRICADCGKRKPISAFRKKGSAKCSLCEGGQHSQLKRVKAALARVVQQQMVAQLRGDRLDMPRITHIAGTMFDLMGGTKGFCEGWFRNLQLAEQDRPGSKMVLDEYHALAKLVQMANTSIDGAGGGVESLSDEDLDREIDNAVARIVNQNVPELEGPDDDADTPDDLDTDEDEFDDSDN